MAKSTKILEEILVLKRDLEKDWRPRLDKINILQDVYPLYNYIDNIKDANTILAFIALAYDAESEFLDPHKDRVENKRAIMRRLAGVDCFKRELYINTVLGGDEIIDSIIEWYINNQKDWRWGDIVSNMELASKADLLAKSVETISDVTEAIKLKKLARDTREDADKMLLTLRKEFMNIDASLENEGKKKLTDRIEVDPFSHEMYLKQRKLREAAIAAEEAAAKNSKSKKSKNAEYEDD
jgi:hypothetical protein